MAAVDLAPAELVLARAWLDLAAPASGSAGDQAAVDLLVGAGWITISSALKPGLLERSVVAYAIVASVPDLSCALRGQGKKQLSVGTPIAAGHDSVITRGSSMTHAIRVRRFVQLAATVVVLTATGCNRDEDAANRDLAISGDASAKSDDAGAPDAAPPAPDAAPPDLLTCHDTLAAFCAKNSCRSWEDEVAFAQENDAGAWCAWIGWCGTYRYVAYSFGFNGVVRFYTESLTLVGAMTTTDTPSLCGGFAWRYGDVPEGVLDDLSLLCRPDGGGTCL